jgi:glycosyltransferase involved in cell wall biosynthesis
MKKILIVSTVSRQFYLFEQGNIEVLKSLGYEIHAAANYSDANERLDALDIKRHHFDIQRSPLSIKNIKAYRQLKMLLKENKFDLVHCHSPMGGVLARLAAKAVGISKVIYTAHGFHFYKGAPFLNWILYYPIERILSKITNVIITINQEDFKRAKKFNADKVKYVPGVGINTRRFDCILGNDKFNKRSELGIPDASFVIASVGELNKNKNHKTIIKSIWHLKDPNIVYLICGQGKHEVYLKKITAEFGLQKQVLFLGYRSDVAEVISIADVFAFPSYREGLSVALMESMSIGLPIICSNIRGNKDLIKENMGGFLVHPDNLNGFIESLKYLRESHEMRYRMGEYNKKEIQKFDTSTVKEKMKKIYLEIND